MKIIEPGNPRAIIPWYCQIEWRCARCGCVFQVEPTDILARLDEEGMGSAAVRVWNGRHYDNDPDQFAAADCPTCHSSVTVNSDMIAEQSGGVDAAVSP
jgi:hypothetical protein